MPFFNGGSDVKITENQASYRIFIMNEIKIALPDSSEQTYRAGTPVAAAAG